MECLDERYPKLKIFISELILKIYEYPGARSGTAAWGTALQVGRSRLRFPMVSFEFFIDIILQAELWPYGWLSL